MNRTILVVAMAATMAGCAAQGPKTAWAKANVSKQDYGTDVGMCTGYAAMATSGNGANTAGGINGQNGGAMGTGTQDQQRAGAGSSGPAPTPTGPQNGAGGSGAAFPTGTGAYRESMSDDMVTRAATQQRTQEMAKLRAQQMALSSCLTKRGYTEIELTSAQRAELGKFKEGSKEYLEYLYKLGADPTVISAQSTK
jgi:hypothetical protein